MNKSKYTKHDIVMNRPASAFCHRWRDGTPIGNGKTGVLFYGGTSAEHLLINRGDMWFCGKDAPVPDVSSTLKVMRELYESGEQVKPHKMMYDALNQKGYATDLAHMRLLGEVKLDFSTKGFSSEYSRVLHMDRAEAELNYKVDGAKHNRRYFCSRKRDITVVELTAEKPVNFSLTAGFFESNEGAREEIAKANDEKTCIRVSNFECFTYAFKNQDKYCGITCRVIADGKVDVNNERICVVNCKKALILIKAFSMRPNIKTAISLTEKSLSSCPTSYEQLLKESLPSYKKLYNATNISIYDGKKHSNEYLLEHAKQNNMSNELAEKVWRFGRYLFISGTTKGALPFPLYGLWPCGYDREFTHHVANENVQSIYWHADVGGLGELVEPLIEYYCNNMEKHRENARQIYGCKGIFVGTYTTPINHNVAWFLPVILHFVGVAGWLSQHFYRYYKFSGNKKLFEQKILPFMLETAEFYEDYHYMDKDGKLALYPAASPENSPKQYWPLDIYFGMPVTKNPTIEIAILKELLTNLVEISSTYPRLKERARVWQEMLNKMPEYRINEDGAVAEWIDPTLTDCYNHRHLSHLYPVFPGTEIEDGGNKKLMKAFQKAVDLREKGSYCGWSMPHMSAIYSRLEQAQDAFATLNALSKVCLLDNFFTMGFDYRDMGITGNDCGSEYRAPVQFDALMSAVNAMQEMLLFVGKNKVKLLPACPKEFNKGRAKLRIGTGMVEFRWDLDKKLCHGKVIAKRQTDIALVLPFSNEQINLKLNKGEEYKF